MRRLAGLALAAIVVLAPGGNAEAAVFGKDTRTVLRQDPHALASSIGTLFATDTGTFCTAFCVAPDKIATASHCLFGTSASPAPRLKQLRFRLGRKNPVSLAGTAIANEHDHIIAGTHQVEVKPPISAAADWAVARLSAPACTGKSLTMTSRPRAAIDRAARQEKIYQVAVHADVGNMQLMHGGPCRLEAASQTTATADALRDFKMPEHIIFHTCDTGGGSSGSPLLLDTPDGPEVVAINVGTYVLRNPLATTADSRRVPKGVAIANTAIETGGIKAAVAELDESDAIATRREVRELQRLMRRKNLYDGPVDGRISKRLISAVEKFAQQSGMQEEPRLRRALLREIAAWNGITTGSIDPRAKKSR